MIWKISKKYMKIKKHGSLMKVMIRKKRSEFIADVLIMEDTLK